MRLVFILLTAFCCLPFVFMMAIYLNWRQNNPPPVGADIGLGMVVLSAYPAVGAMLLWLIYGLYSFLTSESALISPYFSGWRKRVGLLLLVISCLFCVGWVRSFQVVDRLTAFGGRFESHDGSIERYGTNVITVGRISGGVTTMYWSVPYCLILALVILPTTYLLLSKPASKPQPTDNSRRDSEHSIQIEQN